MKEKITARVRHQTVPDEVITRIQFAEALERKDKEILALTQEVKSLKEELLTVKSRNKKLCNILGQGESKYTSLSGKLCTPHIFFFRENIVFLLFSFIQPLS